MKIKILFMKFKSSNVNYGAHYRKIYETEKVITRFFNESEAFWLISHLKL
jgi:translation initiation factor 2 beta subunit (eIF-2beta)/eIF-5